MADEYRRSRVRVIAPLALVTLTLFSAAVYTFTPVKEVADPTVRTRRVPADDKKDAKGREVEYVMLFTCPEYANRARDNMAGNVDDYCQAARVVPKEHLIPAWQEEYLRDKKRKEEEAIARGEEISEEQSKRSAFARFKKGEFDGR